MDRPQVDHFPSGVLAYFPSGARTPRVEVQRAANLLAAETAIHMNRTPTAPVFRGGLRARLQMPANQAQHDGRLPALLFATLKQLNCLKSAAGVFSGLMSSPTWIGDVAVACRDGSLVVLMIDGLSLMARSIVPLVQADDAWRRARIEHVGSWRPKTSNAFGHESWWRRRESNPRPKARPRGTLHACPLLSFRARRVEAAKYRRALASEDLAAARRGATRPPACLMASDPQPPGEAGADVTA